MIRRLADVNGPSPNLSDSSKSASSSQAFPGQPLTYTIELINTGPLSDVSATLTDTIPSGLVYRPHSLEASYGLVDDAQSPTLRWQGTLTPHRAITITYAVIPTGDLGSFVNQAQVAGAAFRSVELSSRVYWLRSVFLPLLLK
jgi:uncharacterized repeat protein (TIGR01451 family)